MIEYPGLTVSEQIELMKKLNIYSPEVENILKWHPNNCPVCNKRYFPSGSLEVRCHECQQKHRHELRQKWYPNYIRGYMRRYRKKQKSL